MSLMLLAVVICSAVCDVGYGCVTSSSVCIEEIRSRICFKSAANSHEMSVRVREIEDSDQPYNITSYGLIPKSNKTLQENRPIHILYF